MTDFGGKLRKAREGRGISLRQIATTTKISVGALEALERNDVSKLPGGIFSRAFVRTYASEIGLDPDETVREFLERFQDVPGPAVTPSPTISAQDREFEERRHQAARVFLVAIVAMLVLGGVVTYFVLQLRPDDTAETPALRQVLPAPAAAEPPPAVSQAVNAQAAASPKPAGEPGIRLELQPTADCWASVVADGRRALQKMIKAGQRETIAARELAVLTVGDAGACAFTINGRPARPLGQAGEVRTVRITPGAIPQLLR